MKSKLFIVIFFLLFTYLFAQSDVRVISSDESSLVFEYTPIYSEITKENIEGTEYLNIAFDRASGYSDSFIGNIFLYYRNIQIGVPNEFGNTIQVLSTQHSIIKGKIAPLSGNENPSKEQITRAEKIFKNKELVSFGEFGYSRELPIQDVLVSPVQYNPTTSEITLYSKIIIKISYASVNRNKTQVKSGLLKSILPNFEVAKNWGRKSEGNSLSKVNPTISNIEGTWYRFKADVEGMYKITRSELSKFGIDANSVDPRTIKIFNNGGYALNEKLTTPTPYGMIENAILVVGEEDGSFDENDYILFYGRGADFWTFNKSSKKIARYHNPFSRSNYYWISFGGANGKRMDKKQSLTSTPNFEQTTTVAFKSLDDDKINIGKSGRDYWGDEFNTRNKSHTYINTLDERLNDKEVLYRYRLANSTKSPLKLTISESGKIIKTRSLPYSSSDYSWGSAHSGSTKYVETLPDNRSALKFEISISAAEQKAYLDYYEIEYQRNLKVLKDEITLFSVGTAGITKYKLNNFSNSSLKVFDVSDYSDVNLISSPHIDGGMIDFTISEIAENRAKYIVLSDAKIKTVKDIKEIKKIEIANSIVAGDGAEYIIITDKKFSTDAERLASYRKNDAQKKYSTKVVYVEDILNEFSCGMMDPTAIRNFLKYGYENWKIKPYFVLLFGDGDYDYLDVEGYSKNYVPTYQSKESLDIIHSFPMDDYYSRISGTSDDQTADIAVGRLNIETTTDAKNVVDKIIAYEKYDNELWKNTVTLVADDRETSHGREGNMHTPQSEELAKYRILRYAGFLDINKIYLAAYPTVITGFGRRKPEVNKAIINAVNNGTLILNYIGHGNPTVWAHEGVFEQVSTIPSLKNEKLFFLTAATCDFGRYDDPTMQSSTEELLLAENRGMIGGFSAARVVYSNANKAINEKFYLHLLRDKDASGIVNITVGEAFRLTKVAKTLDNDEKFHLFCDPAIRLNIPKIPVSIEKVNEQDLTSKVQIKALSKVSISGRVNNFDGTLNANFNGEAVIAVYDSDIIKPLPALGSGSQANMVVPGGIIFRGRATIENGRFSTKFTVPQDISYENRNGKITAYITSDNKDGIGFTREIIIGGTDSTASNDSSGPEIEITFDDAESSSTSLVNQDFTIVLNLHDEVGLNTTGTGIGHKLKGVINDNLSEEIDFTNYFVGDLDAEGKSGKVKYKLTDFELGEHKIEITAWDVFNNNSKQISYFTVVNSKDVVLKDVVNYPNPFKTNTTFLFQHNITEPINVKIKIYTVAGRLIRNIEEYSISDKFVKIAWDGRDEDGSDIASGTYLYKVIIKSIDGQSNQSVLGKLSIVH